MEWPLYSKVQRGVTMEWGGGYKGAPAIIDNSISHPSPKLKLFICIQNPKKFFQYFDF
jgi:hypothetical protein